MAAPNAAQVTAPTTLTTTSETVAAVTPPRNIDQGGPYAQGNLIQAVVSGATGAAATSVQVRVRQGTNGGVGATAPAGTQVGSTVQVSVTAAGFHGVAISVLDATAFALINPAAQYAVSVQQVAATGNGSVTQAQISEESCNSLGT